MCTTEVTTAAGYAAIQPFVMQAPVFRELYSEKRVVFEERRMRVDDSPMGKFQESFAAQAMTNNYRRPVIGYPADLALLGRREVQSFFNEHYGPERLSIAVVGDVHVDVVSPCCCNLFTLNEPCASLSTGVSVFCPSGTFAFVRMYSL